jgi:hypothetical protein
LSTSLLFVVTTDGLSKWTLIERQQWRMKDRNKRNLLSTQQETPDTNADKEKTCKST